MRADAPEPIRRIAKVRFAPMHDAVDERAVSAFDVLSDFVRGIEMIVPEENERTNELLISSGQFQWRQNLIQLLIYLGQ